MQAALLVRKPAPTRRRPSAPVELLSTGRKTRASPPLELDTISSHWQLTLDAALRAFDAAGGLLAGPELGRRRSELALERRQTAELLRRVARLSGVRPVPWLSPVPIDPTMLGLPASARACLFDLDGVLTDSAVLHVQAWGEVFDEFLRRLAEKTGWQFIPFDRSADYRAYMDGRSRLEGINAFLASRGICLPEGTPDDSTEAEKAHGLARRKGEVLARRLRRHGVSPLEGARRYLEAAGHAGLGRAVISASASTLPMLERAGLSSLVEERVDAEVIRVEGLRPRPAPDLLVEACRRLGVRPEEAVTLTHSLAGMAAGHAAGLAVIGVGGEARGELLQSSRTERVVPSLTALLDSRLSGH